MQVSTTKIRLLHGSKRPMKHDSIHRSCYDQHSMCCVPIHAFKIFCGDSTSHGELPLRSRASSYNSAALRSSIANRPEQFATLHVSFKTATWSLDHCPCRRACSWMLAI